jgi:hypothetical protein
MHSATTPLFVGLAATHFRTGRGGQHARLVEAYSEEVTSAPSNCDFSVPTAVGPLERLLQFIALDGPVPALDPVRVQKAMFLFAIDERSKSNEIYDFERSSYGPSSLRIYGDLKILVAKRLVEANPEKGMGWSLYSPTDEGIAAGQELLRMEPDETAARLLSEIKSEVSRHTAGQLIDDLYDRFPEYASECVFARTH